MNNPFKKLLHWLDDIRRKQTTTFDFKIKIPLLALPVFLAVLGGAFQLFFHLGQQTKQDELAAMPTPTPRVIKEVQEKIVPVNISKAGIIEATYQAASHAVTPGISSTPIASDAATPTPPRKFRRVIFSWTRMTRLRF